MQNEPTNALRRLLARIKQQKPIRLIAVAIGLVIVLIAATILMSTGGNKTPVANKAKNAQSTAPAFKNWLAPTSEIKVDTNRYVSICQAFSIEDARKVPGLVTTTDTITEEYLDTSVDTSQRYYNTKCKYGKYVTINTEQYIKPENTKRLNDLVGTYGSKEAPKRIAAYEAAIATTKQTGLNDFITTLKSSTKVATNSVTAKQPTTQSVDGLIIPYGPSLGAYNFQVIYGNVVYDIIIETDQISEDEQLAIPPKQITNILTQAKDISAVLLANAKNKQLSQSPAPTILGSKDKIGSLKVLEPCAILTKGAFKSVTGLEQNSVINRTTISANTANPIQAADQGTLVKLHSNTCKRGYELRTDAGELRKTYLTFELKYALSSTQLDAYYKQQGYAETPAETGSALLQTKADWALEQRLPDDSRRYAFKVGKYLGSVAIDNTNSEAGSAAITFTQGSREMFVQAINTFVDGIKRDQQQTTAR